MLRSTAERRRRQCVDLCRVAGRLRVIDSDRELAELAERVMDELAAEVDRATVDGRPGRELGHPLLPPDEPRTAHAWERFQKRRLDSSARSSQS